MPLTYFFKVLSAFLIFGLLHSVLAVPAIKTRLMDLMGRFAGWYRLAYNILSGVILLVIYFSIPPDPKIFYALAAPWNWLLRVIQACALVIFALTLRDFDGRAFLGLTHRTEQRETLTIKGLFRYCRHPMYSATMIFLLANPIMTVGWMAYSINIILYFTIGSIFEEKHLESQFDAAYLAYKKTVPRFLPKIRR